MISAVFDCMVLLQAIANPHGPAAACLNLVDQGHVRPLVTPATLEEIALVLHRPGMRRTFPALTDELIQIFLDHLLATGQLVENAPIVYRLPRDPGDEPYVNLAIASQPSFLISRDNDLLDLMKNNAFRRSFPAVTILDPVAFLTRVRSGMEK